MPALPPTILFDRTGCLFEQTGTARYINHLQAALTRLGVNLEPFQPYADGTLAGGQPGRHRRILATDFHHQHARPLQLATGRADRVVVHYTAPPARPAPLCSVVTVLDLNILHEPAGFSRYNRWLAHRRMRQLDRAAALITISDFVRAELLAWQPALADRTTTVHLGVSFPIRRLPFAEKNRRLVLFVGGIGPNKNLMRAVQAFAEATRDRADPPLFRLVGPLLHPAYHRELLDLAARCGVADRIQFTGAVSDAELARHFAEAAHFVFLSTREGFGFPLLEAQANGCAVLAARASSLPELGGDSCHYADPTSVPAIAAALRHLLDRPTDAATLAEAGYANVARFSWDRCARETLAVYNAARLRGTPP